MKFDFFKKKDKSQTGKDCSCGCSHEARESVRLTDAEIAEDILRELEQICHDYECLCKEGCSCQDKLCSCKKSKENLCEFVDGQK